MKKTIDHGLQDAGEEAHSKTVNRPHGDDKAKGAWIGPTDRKECCNDGPGERNRSDDESHETQRLFGPAIGTVACEDGCW